MFWMKTLTPSRSTTISYARGSLKPGRISWMDIRSVHANTIHFIELLSYFVIGYIHRKQLQAVLWFSSRCPGQALGALRAYLEILWGMDILTQYWLSPERRWPAGCYSLRPWPAGHYDIPFRTNGFWGCTREICAVATDFNLNQSWYGMSLTSWLIELKLIASTGGGRRRVFQRIRHCLEAERKRCQERSRSQSITYG